MQDDPAHVRLASTGGEGSNVLKEWATPIS
jgi:hypothetical protein